MNYKQFFAKWNLSKISLNLKFLDIEIERSDSDKEAAWDMYVELITRIIIQELPKESGDEKSALDSVYQLFPTTREILKEQGRKAHTFSKIAVVILNQIVRPFTAKWHRYCLAGAFDDRKMCEEFRNDLAILQKDMCSYASMLADLAEVEDIIYYINDIGESLSDNNAVN